MKTLRTIKTIQNFKKPIIWTIAVSSRMLVLKRKLLARSASKRRTHATESTSSTTERR
jgi:hypothetical protein